MTEISDRIKLSKFLALILRHKPDNFGLELDEDGFVGVDDVWVRVVNRFHEKYSFDDLLAVVAGDERGKKRYEIVDGKIRALFGHSQVTQISYPAIVPPELLYHGTAAEAVPEILETGLQARSRQYVHMTSELAIAHTVAHRHSNDIVILVIRAQEAHNSGVVFHNPEENTYLARAVPAQFINVGPD